MRALTLRYHDELRTPEDVGLPELETADVDEVETAVVLAARAAEGAGHPEDAGRAHRDVRGARAEG